MRPAGAGGGPEEPIGGRITVVGLGPAGPEWLTAAGRSTIEDHLADPRAACFVRTTRHPAAGVLASAPSFDHHYEVAGDFADVYARIVDDLVSAAGRHGRVLYAVPGSPRVLERTVTLLGDRAAGAAGDGSPGPEVITVAGPSFLDLVWDRLGVDPVEAGVRLVDGHRFAAAAAGQTGPLLVAHCHNARVLSDIKLAVDDPPPGPVVVLARLGSVDEAVTELDWADLDRAVEADERTSLWIPALASPVGAELVGLAELVATLRERCPWDRAQTHHSLTRHLLEEAHETVDAVEALDDEASGTDPAYEHLGEELGDLLFQVALHARLAEQAGAFDLASVARGVSDKLVARHPHVFAADGTERPPDDASADPVSLGAGWERGKVAEKGRASIFDGITPGLPALLAAVKVLGKAETLGVVPEAADPGPTTGAVDDTGTRDGGSRRIGGVEERVRLGEALLTIAAEARQHRVDPEAALLAAVRRLVSRAQAAEHPIRTGHSEC